MTDFDSAIAALDAAEKRAETTFHRIGRIAQKGAAMPTKVIHAGMGLIVGGAGAAGAILMATDAPAFLVSGVSLGGVLGMFVAILLSRDKVDLRNERASDVHDKCCAMRDREIGRINRQLSDARLAGNGDAEFETRLTRELTYLSVATPLELREYFGLQVDSQRRLPTLNWRDGGQLHSQSSAVAITDQSGQTPSSK